MKAIARNIAEMEASATRKITLKKETINLKVSVLQRETTPGGIVNVVVQATRDSQPVSGFPVQLEAKGVEGTGGHDHIGNRPKGAFAASNGRTSETGKYATLYVASKFGGKERIIVQSPETSRKDSVVLTVRVPHLEALGPGPHYELVGAPDNHAGTNDPCRPAPPTSQHNRNHFGTAALCTAIRNIAASYDSLNPGVRLRINDMSLEFGGLFDSYDNWQGPHAEHRIGENADIGFKGIDRGNECINVNKQELIRLIRSYTAGTTKTHDDHYHIRIR